MKRGHSWMMKSMFRCSLIWQWRALSFWQYQANNWFFFPCRSPVENPVRINGPFSVMFPQYDKQRCIIFVSPPLCFHFKDILDCVFNSEVTFINAPCHDKVERWAVLSLNVKCIERWFLNQSTSWPSYLARKTVIYHQTYGRRWKKAFVKEVAKALLMVALCYWMYFLRIAENNFSSFFFFFWLVR